MVKIANIHQIIDITMNMNLIYHKDFLIVCMCYIHKGGRTGHKIIFHAWTDKLNQWSFKMYCAIIYI